MNLFQLLAFIKHGVPIIIFDIMGNCICIVRDKDDVPSQLFEYPLLNLTCGRAQNLDQTALYITIQK